MPDSRRRVPREAADVHLVDDHLVHRLVERAVAFPVVVGNVDDHAPHRGCQVVARAAGLGPVPEGVGVAVGVGVDEDLVGVEAEPLPVQVRGAVDPVGVVGAGPQSLDVNVPEEEGLVRRRVELDDLGRFPVVVLVEQQQLDRRGVPRKDREVHAVGVRDRAQRMGATGGDFIV